MRIRLTMILSLFLLTDLSAQEVPDWVFHFAFEDATGAKDTVWLALDEEGTFDADEQFGEVALDMNEEEFHVYFFVDNEGGKGDTRVFPLTFSPDGFIYAENYSYPITLSWDTTLFNVPIINNSIVGPISNPYLDNEYFFDFHPDYSAYHMLFDNSVEMPFFNFGSMDHFPLFFVFERGFGDWVGVEENDQAPTTLSPNPTRDILRISTESQVLGVTIYDLQGKIVLSESQLVNQQIDISSFNEGIYIVETITQKGRGVSKIIKVN